MLRLLLLCALATLPMMGWGQTTVTVDFETAGDGYTPTGAYGSGTTDLFNRTNSSLNPANPDGYYWAAEDMNSGTYRIDLDQIDVSGATEFSFSIEMIAAHYDDWDDSDELIITYSLDGATYSNLLWVQCTDAPTGSNEPAALDLAFDGTGDCSEAIASLVVGNSNDGSCDISSTGQNVPQDFTRYNAGPISLSSNSTLDIRLEFINLTSADEGIYIDNIEVTHDGSSTPTPTVGFVNTTSTITEGNSGTSTHTVDVELTNYQGSPVEVEITDANTGSATGSGTDYTYNTQTLTFSSNGTQSVDVTIVGDGASEGDETVDLDLGITSGTANTGNTAHEVTISDDDIAELFISQYIETSSGTTPKGIELWNLSGSTIDFSTDSLVIESYTNGSSSPSTEATITTGSLAHGEVMVIGGNDLQTHMNTNYPGVLFINDPFTFNGNDALEVVLDGIVTDVFGTIGSDPGSEWSGNGVSTEGQSIELKLGIVNGDTDGWSNPSDRFETLISGPTTSSDCDGFGEPPFSVYNGNWSNGAPSSSTGSDDFFIESGNFSSSSDISVNNVLIESGASLTISSNATLTINGDYTNNGTVTVEDGSSVLMDAATTISGDMTVQRIGTEYSNVFNYWSTPVSGTTYSSVWDFGAGSAQHNAADFYTYDPTAATPSAADGWTSISTGSTMTPGQGFTGSGRRDGSANSLSFTGTPNNGTITLGVFDDNGGYNLVGNPFPSAIDANQFISDNTGITGTLWFWDVDVTKDPFVTADYATYNNTGGTGNPFGPTPTGNIASCQGFFLQATADGNVTFNNGQRIAGNNTQFFKSGAIERLWLMATDAVQEQGDQILIGLTDNATDQYDMGWDGPKLKGNPVLSFYSKLNGDDYAIQALAPLNGQSKSVPLGLDAGKAGTYTIAIDSIDGIDPTVGIYLHDVTTGTYHDLRKSNFTVSVNQDNTTLSQYELVFNATPTGIEALGEESWFHAFTQGETIVVRSHGMVHLQQVRLFDLRGRVVYQGATNGPEVRISTADLSGGIYLLEAQSAQGTQTQKVSLP